MKAIVYTGRKTLGGMKVKEVRKPEAGDHEVLVRVRAATVTASDVEGMGLISISRPLRRFSARPDLIPGVEFAGVVEAIGKNVRDYKAGDRVFGSAGTKLGAWAEFISVPKDGILALIPSGMSFDEAAGICDGALTALHFLMNKANMENGQSVLINGASGSVGSYAVQLAKYLKCSVTAVCSASHAGLVRSLGADKVIDYNKEDFTKNGQTYDIVFDAAAKSNFQKCKGILKQNGIYLTTVPSPGILISMLLTRVAGGKRALFAAAGLAKRGVKVKALQEIRELLQAGKLTAIVDKSYPFEQIAEAIGYVGRGHKQGSVLVSSE